MWREQSDSELSVWTGVLALDVGSFFLLQESNILFHHKWTSHYEHHPSVYTQQLCCTEVDSLLSLPSSDSSAGETSTTCSSLPIGLAAAASLVRAVVPDFLFSSLFRFLLRPAWPPLLVPYCAKIRVCVVDGLHVDLVKTGVPLSICILLQQHRLLMDSAQWSAKQTATGFSVSFFWPRQCTWLV